MNCFTSSRECRLNGVRGIGSGAVRAPEMSLGSSLWPPAPVARGVAGMGTGRGTLMGTLMWLSPIAQRVFVQQQFKGLQEIRDHRRVMLGQDCNRRASSLQTGALEFTVWNARLSVLSTPH